MAKIEIKDASGKKVKEADLNAAVFGIEPNVHVMHTVVRAYRAAMRQGTHDTKTRGEVRGGGKKPWRRRAPAALVRVRSVLPSGPAAVPCSVRIPAATSSASTARKSSWLCAPLCLPSSPMSS